MQKYGSLLRQRFWKGNYDEGVAGIYSVGDSVGAVPAGGGAATAAVAGCVGAVDSVSHCGHCCKRDFGIRQKHPLSAGTDSGLSRRALGFGNRGFHGMALKFFYDKIW